jgi:hypothetical protein
MYYWTSGAFLNTSSPFRKAFWCATNMSSAVLISSKRGDGSEKCVAYERWTGTFKELNCSKRLSFICEVQYYLGSLNMFNKSNMPQYPCQNAVCPPKDQCVHNVWEYSFPLGIFIFQMHILDHSFLQEWKLRVPK